MLKEANRLHTGLFRKDTVEVPRNAPRLKYMEVADDIRRRILSGDFGLGTVMPGQRQLADELGVSRESVKRAMRLLEEEGLLKCLPSVGCVVERAPGQVLRVGYLVADLADPFHGGIIRELDAALSQRNGALLVGEGDDPRRVLDAGAIMLIKQHYIGCEHSDDPAGTVYIGGGSAGKHVVRSADRRGIRLVYDHLRELGHERIAYYGPKLPVGTDDRHDVWRAAVEADGFGGPDAFFSDGGSDGVVSMLRTIRDGEAGITALICFDDQRAIAALQQAMEMGFNVPGDLSITGYDDVATSRHLMVPLTTVSYAARDIARAALEILFDEENGTPQERVIPVELIVRDSTGPVKTRS